LLRWRAERWRPCPLARAKPAAVPVPNPTRYDEENAVIFNGLLDLSVWGYVAAALLMTHVTIAGVTVYLHRYQAHRAIELHPVIGHCFRAWLWLTTGMSTREWTAVHRKHHAYVERPGDPHSPRILGIRKVLWDGVSVYREAALDPETLRQFGHGTPEDWLERHLYHPHGYWGITLMFVLDFLLFGFAGITIWAVQMAWIPFFAAGVINGIGHYRGYRNYECPDASRNIVPIGILIGGEELHNNHHAFASSAKFSARWWEFDIGWVYIRTLAGLGLARVKKLAPRRVLRRAHPRVDLETVQAVVTARLEVMADYARHVIGRVYRDELAHATEQYRQVIAAARGLLHREDVLLSADARLRLQRALAANRSLEIAYQFRQRLQALWAQRNATPEALLQQLHDWCRQAEDTGIQALAEFARVLRGYALQSHPA
jgi:stearoyl-CoA desaturase (delta-9 desaturase)